MSTPIDCIGSAHRFSACLLVLGLAAASCATFDSAPPTGSEEKPSEEEAAAMKAMAGKVKGTIVWSSSRLGNHDLFTMNTDGSHVKAITLRGSKRETGIWDLKKKSWRQTGLGCQINWTPDGSSIYWVNPTGNGQSEVFKMPVKNGKPPKDIADDALRFMDVPGRRSHE